jgi:hypothetical protein
MLTARSWELAMKFIPPSVDLTAFNCPHCGVLTTQYWHSLRANRLNDTDTPTVVTPASEASFDYSVIPENVQEGLRRYRARAASGVPWLGTPDWEQSKHDVGNIHLSRCYECSALTIWLHDRILWPSSGEAPPINVDTPKDIRREYLEAATIVHQSPRGAAALLRLGIQKLCAELGGTGNNINSDIAALGALGIGKQVQQAMDVLRVIGNNAVHPGQIDMKDDQKTALSLFRVFNLIVEKTISDQKHVDELFESLPPEAKAQIDKRDEKARKALPAPEKAN